MPNEQVPRTPRDYSSNALKFAVDSCRAHIGDGSIGRINSNSNDIALWGFHTTKNFLTYYFVPFRIRLRRFDRGNILHEKQHRNRHRYLRQRGG